MPAVVSPPRGPLGELAADVAKIATISVTGAATVRTVGRIYNDTDANLTVAATRVSAATQPTGAALIVDLVRPAPNAGSIYSAAGQRPTVAVSTSTALGGTLSAAGAVLAPGEYLEAQIAQVGSTVAGSDLVIEVTFTA